MLDLTNLMAGSGNDDTDIEEDNHSAFQTHPMTDYSGVSVVRGRLLFVFYLPILLQSLLTQLGISEMLAQLFNIAYSADSLPQFLHGDRSVPS